MFEGGVFDIKNMYWGSWIVFFLMGSGHLLFLEIQSSTVDCINDVYLYRWEENSWWVWTHG